MPIQVREHAQGISVSSQFWTIEHSATSGGTWTSIIFTNGSKQNLLREPAGSALRFVKADPKSDHGIFTAFCEKNEKAPRLKIEQSAEGVVSVVAEGTFRDESGATVPVGYRRRTEYHEHGLIWTTLDIMSDAGCEGVVEVRALEIALRNGISDCFARLHPTQGGSADLCGAAAHFDVSEKANSIPFCSRFTPLQLTLLNRGREGIEIFPGSELAVFDCALKSEPGVGNYQVTQEAGGTRVDWSPYCMAHRRIRTTVKGTLSYRVGMALPELKSTSAQKETQSHAFVDNHWPDEAALKTLVNSGTKLLVFRNDYREDGPFWRSGAYPPYDADGMRELLRLISNAHSAGLKIVPYVSLKKLHPDGPAFVANSREWMHQASPALEMIHDWSGSGERGALMCMKSGWVDFRKQTVDTILNDLPWDGLYLDDVAPQPCCHPKHGKLPYHSDIDEVIHFLQHCRRKLGPERILMANLTATPSLIVANLSDLVVDNGCLQNISQSSSEKKAR